MVPLPENEPERLAALRSYEILDTPPEIAYDRLTELAARICACPVAYVKFIDETRGWFKSQRGFPPDVVEVPREITVCATTICQSDLLVVPDLSADVRFRDSPAVTGWPHLRFYCGMPLIDPDGYALGTLCVVDLEPREVSFEQQEAIRTLAQEVVIQLSLRRTATRLSGSLAELEAARAKADALLCDILPKEVAEELKRTGEVQPRFYPLVTVLFGDFEGFMSKAAGMEPARLVQTLDQYFGSFDGIVERHGLEKIKTIGDCYMCAGGVPGENLTHVVDSALAALEMQDCLARLNREREKLRLDGWRMRIGLHAGPVMTGVVGRRKFTYDIWGDVVNVAQRMEAAGEPGRVNVSDAVYQRTRHLFDYTPRGPVEVAEKGPLEMYFLERIQPAFAADAAGLRPNDAFARAQRGISLATGL